MKKISQFVVSITVVILVGCQQTKNVSNDGSSSPAISISSSPSSLAQTHTIVYRNNKLGLEITLPLGWYLPKADDTDPHFYENEECPNQDHPQCAAFEIQQNSAWSASEKKAFMEEANGQSTSSLPKRLTFIPRAIVVQTELGEGVEGWKYEYGALFQDNDKVIFTIFSNDQMLEATVFPTIKVIK